jgi:hydrogenase maturation factor HypF (carbamoyltransferase family)
MANNFASFEKESAIEIEQLQVEKLSQPETVYTILKRSRSCLTEHALFHNFRGTLTDAVRQEIALHFENHVKRISRVRAHGTRVFKGSVPML